MKVFAIRNKCPGGGIAPGCPNFHQIVGEKECRKKSDDIDSQRAFRWWQRASPEQSAENKRYDRWQKHAKLQSFDRTFILICWITKEVSIISCTDIYKYLAHRYVSQRHWPWLAVESKVRLDEGNFRSHDKWPCLQLLTSMSSQEILDSQEPTQKVLIQHAIEANKRLQQILTEKAHRIEAELAQADKLLVSGNLLSKLSTWLDQQSAASTDDGSDDPHVDVEIPGAKKAAGPFPPSELLNCVRLSLLLLTTDLYSVPGLSFLCGGFAKAAIYE